MFLWHWTCIIILLPFAFEFKFWKMGWNGEWLGKNVVFFFFIKFFCRYCLHCCFILHKIKALLNNLDDSFLTFFPVQSGRLVYAVHSRRMDCTSYLQPSQFYFIVTGRYSVVPNIHIKVDFCDLWIVSKNFFRGFCVLEP